MKNVFLTEKQIQYIHNENRKECGIIKMVMKNGKDNI